MLSIIVVAYNEERCIEATLQNLQELPCDEAVELIVALGHSTDQTSAIASRYAHIVNSPTGRAKQMNAAANVAQGDILFFVHADMRFHPDTLTAICHHLRDLNYDGGGFANIFDRHNKKIKQLGVLLNFRFLDRREQSDRNIFYGDNGIFVRKSAFEALGGFKDLPIMEDYDFSIRLRTHYKVKQIREPRLIVSARRHEKAGFLKTRLQWVLIKKLYLLGLPPQWLAAWYRDVR